MSAWLVLAGALTLVLGGAIAPLAGSRSGAIPGFVQALGGAIGLCGAVLGLGATPTEITIPWLIPGGPGAIHVDPLSAFFATPVFLLAALGAIYGERYWPHSAPRGSWVRGFFGLAAGALALVMVASHMLLFVALWEIVAVANFFLVATDESEPPVRSAAWLYLAVSHVATLALFGVVTILHGITGSWSFAAIPLEAALGEPGKALFWIALIAFGTKAGLMPLHVWLPGAHAAAPSHVSALMSGVVIKMGVCGFVRVLSLYPETPAWMGGTLLAFGIVSSLLGVAFALAQHDIKRLLAYHSIENIGIIFVGLGAGLVARSYGAGSIASLALAGGLLHVWNHGLFKALLFLGAGGVIHGAHTRQIDRLGGLAHRMPSVATGFLVGAVAISGLPPLNGFVSEWLIYRAGFAAVAQKAAGWPWLLLLAAVPALALTGALALACFVKAFGAVFLGAPRSPAAAGATSPPASMTGAMLPLVLACVGIGVAPVALAPVLSAVVAGFAGVGGDLAAPLAPLQSIALVLVPLLVLPALVLHRSLRSAPREVTWDCGYARPTARMQYTATSTARMLVSYFARVMPETLHAPRRLRLFPKRAELSSHVPDTVLDRALLPAFRLLERGTAATHRIQGGRIQLYLVYVGATLLALLVWSSR